MATFDEELQIILDRHPEIEEVRVKYKKTGTVFKPRLFSQQQTQLHPVGNTEFSMVQDMINKGEL